MTTFLRRIAPFAVIGAALSFSAWSLFVVARHLGAPIPVAAVVSIIFDGGAIWLATLAADYSREGDSAFGPRLMVVILAGTSAWLNRLHAVYGHFPASSELLWMAPPVVAAAIFEFTLKYVHRKTLRAANRIPSSMDRYDSLSWFINPIKTFRELATVVEYRRNTTTLRATGGLIPGTGDQSGETGGQFRQLAPNAADVRAWAATAGVHVNKSGPVPASVESAYRHAMTRRALAAADGQGGEPDPDPEPAHLADVPRPRALFAEPANADVDAAFRAVNGSRPTDRESLS